MKISAYQFEIVVSAKAQIQIIGFEPSFARPQKSAVITRNIMSPFVHTRNQITARLNAVSM